jgi:hypothetical protein
MDQKIVETLLAANMGALGAAMQAWRILANNGLLNPADLDEMSHGITGLLEQLEGNPLADAMLGQLRAHIEPQVAHMYQVAQRTWRERNP